MRMRFGVFIAPFHNRMKSPTVALHRDLDLVQHLDALGFDEAWIGEHHSGGVELVPSPEIMLATLAERTRRIRLGTGVTSLSYHHPMTVAERMVLLDHLTMGRVMLGVGPGALAVDAYQRGIDPRDQRRRMEESLEVILDLFRGEGLVTRSTDWFDLVDGHLHLRPFQERMDVAVSAMVSPTGPALAGRTGSGLLSMGATLIESARDALAAHWDVYAAECEKAGHVADRGRWRLVAPFHVAETREQAMKEVEYGIKQWADYELDVANLPLVGEARSPREAAEHMVEVGAAAIGTPADLIEMIEKLQAESGGFGTLLNMACNWADDAATKRSFALVADEVMPHFQGQLDSLRGSYDWGTEAKAVVGGKAGEAFLKATSGYFGADHARTRRLADMLGAMAGEGKAE
ncbi:LLM class flavin-dependent oxidoreductase [Nocardioides sp. BYT-33-1]|uniref:LLM class flavin-dependent oxidoreductase n=1 Tax=Nocardioides sp. BYT-33-1 TaxID=3416952 RepID=UPI003F53A837